MSKKESCLVCGKTNVKLISFVEGKSGKLCPECIQQAAKIMIEHLEKE